MIALCALQASCAASTETRVADPSAAAQASNAPRQRTRPSARTMHRALDRLANEARRCLNAGVPAVIVRGDFIGETGEFQVERVTLNGSAVAGYAVETCVRVVASRARVRPFRDESAIFEYTLRASDVNDEIIIDGLPAPTPEGNPYAMPAPAPVPPSAAPTARPVQQGSGIVAPTVVVQGNPTPLELIRRDADAFQRCYEQACQRDHTVAGELEIHLRLDGQGRVARLESRVHTSHEDETLMELVARCVESHVRLISFGPQQTPNAETVARLQFSPSSIPIE